MRIGIGKQALLCARELEIFPTRANASSMKKAASNTEPTSPFQQNVLAAIERAGGQIPLAADIDVNQGTISKWKNKGVWREVDLVQRLADYLGVSFDHVISRPVTIPAKAVDSHAILLPVSLPSEAALTRMFETFLEKHVPGDQRDALAQNLAQRLPAGLAHASIAPPVPVRGESPALDEGVPPPAKPRRPRPPAQRT